MGVLFLLISRMDIWYYNYCVVSGRAPGRLGVIETMFITHNPLNMPSTNNINAEKSGGMQGQKDEWQSTRNIALIDSWPKDIGVLEL